MAGAIEQALEKFIKIKAVVTQRRASIDLRIPRFSVEIVGIDQRGEHHADQERRAKSSVTCISRLNAGRQKLGQRNLVLPNGGQWGRRRRESIGQRADSFAVHAIGQARVMAGNAVGDDLSERPRIPLQCGLSTRGGVIDTGRISRESVLKFVGVLAEVVQKASRLSQVSNARGVKKSGSAVACVPMVLRQEMPACRLK